MNVLVLDTETTGLDITKHEIIQLGYILINLNENNTFSILKEKEFKIKPQNIAGASPEALKINGYTSNGWRYTKAFDHHAVEIRNEIESADLMLGQNLVFDLRFLRQSFHNFSLVPPRFPRYMDTKKMASVLVNKRVLKSASMDSMCEHFSVISEGRSHTALVDCHRTLKIWKKLVEQDVDFEFYSF